MNKITVFFTVLLFNSGLYSMNLFDAIRADNFDRVRELIHDHPNFITTGIGTGHTALMIAAGSGHLGITRFLCEQGFDVNAVEETGSTALSYGVSARSLPIVQYLLLRGARANARINSRGETVAARAIEQGSLDIVRVLVDDGCIDLRASDYYGRSIYKVARDHRKPEILAYLNNLLLAPTIAGDVKGVRKLLTQGAFLNCHGQERETPLMIASRQGRFDIVKSLLRPDGCDILAQKENGETAVRMAVESGCIEVVQVLIDRGADSDVPDNGGFTPLMWAVANNQIGIVPLLIAHTKKIDACNMHGHTALMIAADIGDEEVVRLLIDGGAKLNLFDHDGQTALMHAAKSGRLRVINLLLSEGAKALSRTQDRELLKLVMHEAIEQEVRLSALEGRR